ncbi:MAG: DUF3667 domain-containing protein [Saprospiraceae bacterium]
MEPNPDIQTEEQPKPVCSNCGEKMTRKGHFCPHCGQKKFDGRIRMRDLLSKFLHNITHLDGKFVRMAWQLLVPGRVTMAYFQGKIKRYPHPVQFFFVVMFFFLFLLNKTLDSGQKRISSRTGASIHIQMDGNKEAGEESRIGAEDFFKTLERQALVREFQASYTDLPAALQTPAVRAAFDSSALHMSANYRLLLSDIQEELDSAGEKSVRADLLLDTIPIGLVNKEYRFAITDLLRLSPDELLDQYGITNWKDRIMVKQGIKSIKEPKGLLHAYLGSLTWTILALVALMSVILALLYRRQRRYYVEHFIFLLHQHSGAFLLLTLVLLGSLWVDMRWAWLLMFAWIGLSLLIAMKNFYGESWVKTLLKWTAYSLLYLISFGCLFFFGLLIVFFVF